MNSFDDEDQIIFLEENIDSAKFGEMYSNKTEKRMREAKMPDNIAILPLRNNVLFPGIIIPITVGREKSIKLIEDHEKGKKILGVIAQRNADIDNPNWNDLHNYGTFARIVKLFRMPDGSTTVLLQGAKRFKTLEPYQTEPYIRATVEPCEEAVFPVNDAQFNAQLETVKEIAIQIVQESPMIPNEAKQTLNSIQSPNLLLNFICAHMNANVDRKQEILEQLSAEDRIVKIAETLAMESHMVEMRNDLNSKVRREMDKQQREYFLQQQIKTIQDELGDNPQENDIQEMERRAKDKQWDERVAKIFTKELNKFKRMNPQGAEYSVQLNFLDTLLELPWNEFSNDDMDLKKAAEILDRDHFGMVKVKERILEYLAVNKLRGDMRSPILCFYGPPGVGKTSLGKSIAEALGRKYVRMSLGGLHDESEIRGHRKTYIGAMPGRIIQHIKKAGMSNPVFILDEIDKLGKSNHGDPSSALLEVLDPEQNSSFYDNFIETEYDLSKVMFIATANSMSSIQGPLRDRMEIIEVNGYTVEEKIEIAKRHLIPKQISEHGITSSQLKIDKKAVEGLIELYTSESGVRSLDKRIAKVVRSRAKQIAMDEKFEVKVAQKDLVKILGPGRERTKYISNEVPGVVTGLAWTSVGGDILFIESSLTKGKGKLTLTGNLGDVMKESAVIALEYLRSHCDLLGLNQEGLDECNVHIHVPEGATPKDGPSAGITMLTSLASSFTKRKVKKNLAMTGEITLRGDVLPVGGIKEKILAAKRASIKEIILCERNRQDVEEIESEYLKGLTFHYVKKMEDVLKISLL
jgi:ATP-dependent Lon protease